jgi:hypothetical protein
VTVDKEEEYYQIGYHSIPCNSYAAKALIAQARYEDKPLNQIFVGLPVVQDYAPHLKESHEPLSIEQEIVIEEFREAVEKEYPGSYEEIPKSKQELEREEQKGENLYEMENGHTMIISSQFPKPSQFAALSEHLIQTGYCLPVEKMTVENFHRNLRNWNHVIQEKRKHKDKEKQRRQRNPIKESNAPRQGKRVGKWKTSQIEPGERRKNREIYRIRKKFLDEDGQEYPVRFIMDPLSKGRQSTLYRSGCQFWRRGVAVMPDRVIESIKRAIRESAPNHRMNIRKAMQYMAILIGESGIKWNDESLGEVNPLEMAIIALLSETSWRTICERIIGGYQFNKKGLG